MEFVIYFLIAHFIYDILVLGIATLVHHYKLRKFRNSVKVIEMSVPEKDDIWH